jgi:hypothetical protein
VVNYDFFASYSSRALILQTTITLGNAAEASAPGAPDRG